MNVSLNPINFLLQHIIMQKETNNPLTFTEAGLSNLVYSESLPMWEKQAPHKS
jgi:hypothetical protein